MNRDMFSRYLAIGAILVAVGAMAFDDSCNCKGNARRNRVGWVARWVTWMAVKDEFESSPPLQDPGATLYENTPPEREKGPTGEVELTHGRGW